MSDDVVTDFQWPDAPWPSRDWWELTGAELGLSDELVKFAAALARLGGADSRNNSLAARLAGMSIGRTVAFRHARSVGVRKLLGKAEQIHSGKFRPLSEEEIERRLAEMIRSANDVAAAKAIELRDKRKPPYELSHDEVDSFATLVSLFGENAARMIDAQMKADFLEKGGLKVAECTCGLRLNAPARTD